MNRLKPCLPALLAACILLVVVNNSRMFITKDKNKPGRTITTCQSEVAALVRSGPEEKPTLLELDMLSRGFYTVMDIVPPRKYFYKPNIPYEDYPDVLDSQLAYEEKVKEVLKEYGIELIVLAGFMSILSENFTSAFPKRIINIHPSLIPSFCGKGYYGLKVHEAALAYGVKVTGATVHYVNEIPDGGEILMQKAVEVKDGDTPEVLQRRVMEEAEWILLPRATEQVSKELQKGR